MQRRVTLATAIAATVLTTLAGCGSDGSAGESDPTSAAPSATTSEPSADPSSAPDAKALAGDWQIPSEQYVLHLVNDGTFVEDYQGVTGFRTGTYTVEGDTLSLVGGDGNTDPAKIVGDTLEFNLGTATRIG